MSSDASSQQSEYPQRPIDRYPRVRDAGRWIMASGVLQAVLGLGFVYQAWQGHSPGIAALFAFVMGMIASGLALEYMENDAFDRDAS